MNLKWSSFYFGTRTTESAFILDLEIASVTYAVELPYGRFAPKTFRAVLEANILSQTGVTCLVDFDYTSRTYRLTFGSTVTILGATGANAGVSLLPVIGLPLTDQTGTVFTGSGGSCLKFEPNFPLSAFTDKVNTIEFFGLKSSETAGQLREAVSFGRRVFYRFGIRYITNQFCEEGSYIKQNPVAVSQAIAFFENCISLQGIDFFLDRSLIASGYTTRPTDTIQLDLGTGAKDSAELLEMTGDGLSGFYEIPIQRFDVFNIEPLSDITPEELSRLLQEVGDLILLESGGGILL